MKKVLILSLALIMILVLTSAHAAASPEDMKGQTFPDFSAKTINAQPSPFQNLWKLMIWFSLISGPHGAAHAAWSFRVLKLHGNNIPIGWM